MAQKVWYLMCKYQWNYYLPLRLNVLTAVIIMSSGFWDITPCSPMKVYQHFRGTYYHFHLQWWSKSQASNQHGVPKVHFGFLLDADINHKGGGIYSFETLTSPDYTAEDRTLYYMVLHSPKTWASSTQGFFSILNYAFRPFWKISSMVQHVTCI